MLKKFLTLILMFLPVFSYAAETDNYTLADHQVVDVTYELNQYANFSLAGALERINREGVCIIDEDNLPAYPNEGFVQNIIPQERIYEELTQIFANHYTSRLIQYFLDGTMQRTVITLKESVYREWSAGDGLLLAGNFGDEDNPLALSPLIKVGGYVIGVDKLEHMFGMGYAYFKRHHVKGMSLEGTLKFGIAAEKTYLGGNMFETGVFSYSDLSANFNGMRFWNHMLQKEDDVLGQEHNYGPYIVCDGGKWRQNKKIDFKNYIDKSMMENINCSKFATQEGVRKFKDSLVRLYEETGGSRSFSCPISPDALEEAASKYLVPIRGGSTIDHWIINRDGNGQISYSDEFTY